MAEFIAATLILILSSLVGIWVMMTGWGLSVASWPVIIGGIVIQWVFYALLQMLRD